MIWLWVAAAGGAGAVVRYLVDLAVTTNIGGDAPWGTWVVNVTGSFLAGVVAGLVIREMVTLELSAVVAGGFLGAYTTFSTAMVQAALQVEEPPRIAGIVNLVGTLVASLLAAFGGVALVS